MSGSVTVGGLFDRISCLVVQKKFLVILVVS
jgi:hypothetical protein